MSSIQGIVNSLKEAPGVKGAALVTGDGIVIASALGCELNSEVVAGLASFLITTTRRSLTEGRFGTFKRLMIQATNGKLLLLDLGESFLIVQTDQFARLTDSRAEVDAAAEALQSLSRIE